MTRGLRPRLLAGAAIGAAVCASAAFAETARDVTVTPQAPAAPGETVNGRFTMTPVSDGFLRLDTRTGQVSLCKIDAGQAQCRASADERAALQAEIDRLAKENAALKARPQSPGDAAENDDDRRFDKALDRAERFIRRMMQLFRDAGGKPPPTSL